jgi:transcriptional regulator with XRE-family HTH domain
MTDLRKVLALNMKYYRKKQGISQAKLAEEADITENYIAMIETGKRFPTVTIIERIAKALQRDTVEFFSVKQDDPLRKKTIKTKILTDIEAILTVRLNEIES